MTKIIKCPKCNNTLTYIHYTRGFFERGGDIWEVSCWWCGYVHKNICHGYTSEKFTKEIKKGIEILKKGIPDYKKIFGTEYFEQFLNPIFNLRMK